MDENWQPDKYNNAPGSQLRMFHRDGVDWFDAPLPRRWHRCFAQTKAWYHSKGLLPLFVERCPCGAIRLNGRGWMDRNKRKAHHD